MLEIKALNFHYGNVQALYDIDMTMPPGQITCVMGRNGVGKTTLLRTAAGFVQPQSGDVRLDGQRLAGIAPYRVARRALCYVAQEQALFADLTVGENLRLGVPQDRLFRERLPLIEPHFPVLLQRLGQKAGTLSGGEQKMLLISRAILARPRLMLVDEISEGLQPSVVDRLAGVLAAGGAERRLRAQRRRPLRRADLGRGGGARRHPGRRGGGADRAAHDDLTSRQWSFPG